jgi:hypothetical protein
MIKVYEINGFICYISISYQLLKIYIIELIVIILNEKIYFKLFNALSIIWINILL